MAEVLESLRERLALRAAPFDPSRAFEDWDANGDQRVDRQEFERIATRWLGYDVPMADIDALFRALDADGNGTLSRRELLAVLQPPARYAM